MMCWSRIEFRRFVIVCLTNALAFSLLLVLIPFCLYADFIEWVVWHSSLTGHRRTLTVAAIFFSTIALMLYMLLPSLFGWARAIMPVFDSTVFSAEDICRSSDNLFGDAYQTVCLGVLTIRCAAKFLIRLIRIAWVDYPHLTLGFLIFIYVCDPGMARD